MTSWLMTSITLFVVARVWDINELRRTVLLGMKTTPVKMFFHQNWWSRNFSL